MLPVVRLLSAPQTHKLQAEIELIGDVPPPPTGPEEDLKITVHDRIHNAIVSYIMSNNTRMAILMNKHSEMAAYNLDTVNFLLGARKIQPQDTPYSVSHYCCIVELILIRSRFKQKQLGVSLVSDQLRTRWWQADISKQHTDE